MLHNRAPGVSITAQIGFDESAGAGLGQGHRPTQRAIAVQGVSKRVIGHHHVEYAGSGGEVQLVCERGVVQDHRAAGLERHVGTEILPVGGDANVSLRSIRASPRQSCDIDNE